MKNAVLNQPKAQDQTSSCNHWEEFTIYFAKTQTSRTISTRPCKDLFWFQPTWPMVFIQTTLTNIKSTIKLKSIKVSLLRLTSTKDTLLIWCQLRSSEFWQKRATFQSKISSLKTTAHVVQQSAQFWQAVQVWKPSTWEFQCWVCTQSDKPAVSLIQFTTTNCSRLSTSSTRASTMICSTIDDLLNQMI